MTDRQSSRHALVELTSPSGHITLETADTYCTVRFDGEIEAAISLASFQQVTAAVDGRLAELSTAAAVDSVLGLYPQGDVHARHLNRWRGVHSR